MTIEELKQVLTILDVTQPAATPSRPFVIGECVFIRTITQYYVGKVKDWYADFIVLEEASWIPDTGRFSECLTIGAFSEIEPFPNPVYIARAAIVDLTKWSHELPLKVK